MDLDDNLARLSAVPVPGLAAIDGATLATQARVEALRARTTMGVAMLAALGIGVVSGLSGETRAETPLVAFGPAPSLTPLIALGQP